MKSFFSNLAKAIHDLLTSKKFLTGALTTGAAMVIKDPATRQLVVGSGMAVILGQGAADFGKNAK